MDQGLKRGGSVTGAGASARAAPVRVASSVTAPLHRIPPPPPPKATAATTTRGQQQASRYRSLRGKSISSPVRANKLIIYSDQTGSDDGVNTVSQGSPTRNRKRRSKSVVEKTHRLFPADLQATAKENGRPSTGINSAAAGATTGNLNTSSTTSKLSPLLPINLPLKNRCPNLSSSTPSTPQGTDWKTLDNYKPASLLRLKEASSPLQQQKGVAIYQPQFGKENQIPVHRDGGVPWADEVARLEAETDRILAEQKKCDLARLEAQLAAAPSPKSKTKPKPKQLILDTFPFLSKRPNGTGHSGPNTPKSAPAKTLGFPWSPTFSLGDKSPSPFAMSFIEYGGGGTVPQIDAPTSAINGGERRVTVRCLSSTLNLPVNPDTCPPDLAYATANLITHKIDPAASIVIESFEVLGLERRLRQYEAVREVMNSWDRDQQNNLIVSSYDTPHDVVDLNLASVPRTEDAPTGFTFHMYHSSRPGKWNKRWVTLMDNGQMFASKRPESTSTDKDSAVLCHLSDFDIYTPKASELQRHLKAPKKFCYAIKSQQKTYLFPNGENFVHFFSTEDEKLAFRFHELVHGWRSWYLVNKKIDFDDQEGPSSSAQSSASLKKSTSIARSSTQRGRGSNERHYYTIGNFQPLIDMAQFDKPLEAFGENLPSGKGAGETQNQQGAARPQVQTKTRHGESAAPSLKSPQSRAASSEQEFLAGGLLGDAYDKRKQTDTSTEEPKEADGPFTQGPSLLNNLTKSPTSPIEKPDAASWFPSALEHTARSRPPPKQPQPSRRPQTADNRPPKSGSDYAESIRSRPSQRQGVGRGVKPPNGSPLIDFASGGATSDQPIPSRNSSKSSSGGQPYSGRPRSRSTATTRSGGQRAGPSDRPPVPPLPYRSAKRAGDQRVFTDPSTSSRGGAGTAGTGLPEPLINRVK